MQQMWSYEGRAHTLLIDKFLCDLFRFVYTSLGLLKEQIIQVLKELNQYKFDVGVLKKKCRVCGSVLSGSTAEGRVLGTVLSMAIMAGAAFTFNSLGMMEMLRISWLWHAGFGRNSIPFQLSNAINAFLKA